jgi:hypothetical protein
MTTRFDRFYADLSIRLPGFKIAYKDESWLMKIISYILFYNKTFMTNYTTTIGKTVYFPNRQFVQNKSFNAINILAHEFVHAKDSNRQGEIIFSFFYLFPQSLSLFMLLLLPTSVIISLVLFAIFLSPLPAYWRKIYEMRGYQMSLFTYAELMRELNYSEEDIKENLQKAAKNFNKHFISSDYYFMWPFGVDEELNETIDKIISGDIFSVDRLYRDVSESLQASKSP